MPQRYGTSHPDRPLLIYNNTLRCPKSCDKHEHRPGASVLFGLSISLSFGSCFHFIYATSQEKMIHALMKAVWLRPWNTATERTVTHMKWIIFYQLCIKSQISSLFISRYFSIPQPNPGLGFGSNTKSMLFIPSFEGEHIVLPKKMN